MADDLSLQPLQISPEMAARARQEVEQGQEQDASQHEDMTTQLKCMFPDYDNEVLNSVLAANGNDVGTTIEQLLSMGTEDGGGAVGASGSGAIDSDEELARMLFEQFANDAEIPDEVKADPQKYEEFIRKQFEEQLGTEGSALSQQMDAMIATRPEMASEQSKSAFMARMKKMPSLFRSNNRMGMVAVDEGTKPLLSDERI